MNTNVMMSLDLHDAEDESRKDFYAKLESFNWGKVKEVSTVWIKEFDRFQTLASIRSDIAKEIDTSATDARVSCSAVFMIGREDKSSGNKSHLGFYEVDFRKPDTFDSSKW